VQPAADVSMPLAFDDFYQREYRSLVAFAYALCGSWGGAEELAQDAFESLLRDWDRIRTFAAPNAWLRRAVANRATSRWRRAASEAKALARLTHQRELPAGVAVAVDSEFWSAVRALPARQAQVIVLHYLEDRPVDEIASVLGIAGGTVKAHLHRARAALAATLGLEVDDDH
jgi:RNA polymerase sigma-70 factor (ECF subfamily)